ncbi:MAG: hypothetical protein AVDCRST_MAG85-760 [uncultured Solirubrobacteraceae bacterium]|uniref:Small secreted protein n=1 Tax=uncultured Solirubrobacteraceae bacterium TaxID=1162706 RepID=A0A6J4RV96_9ACTN|nr:MAG: hypothetical protein AVDCRST_MAG85-760 [uncultured Solirubrobacteraceae bacterium]
MHLSKISGLTALALVSTIAFGCGDDEGGGALSKTEFEKQGNEICKKFETESKKLGNPQSIEELPEYADKALALFDKQLGELRELEPPKEYKSDFDKLLKTGDEAKGFIRDLKEAAESKDEKKIAAVGKEAESRDQTSDELAQKVGLTECGQD